MSNLYAPAILTDFCLRNQLPDLKFDRQGLCHLLLDGQVPITFYSPQESQRLTIIAQMQNSLPDHASKAWIKDVLTAALNPMLGNKPGLGWHSEMGLVAFIHLDQRQGEGKPFENELAELAEWVGKWREDNTHWK